MTGTGTAADLIRDLEPHVADDRVLSAIKAVPRESFVPAELRSSAWENRAPIGEGETISQPLVVARMCELLQLSGSERVLDVGTGSGYHAAVLARLARSVISIERHTRLSEQAAANLGEAGIDNVTLVVGDGTQGHPREAPHDAINVAAASEQLPDALLSQLAPGGRLVARIRSFPFCSQSCSQMSGPGDCAGAAAVLRRRSLEAAEALRMLAHAEREGGTYNLTGRAPGLA